MSSWAIEKSGYRFEKLPGLKNTLGLASFLCPAQLSITILYSK